jgi:uncharacterized protein (DUF2252 family)
MSQKWMTREQRTHFGLKWRAHMKRVELATFSSTADRDAIGVLKMSCTGRLNELLPIKWKRMSAGPFAFFRGSAPVMAADLAAGKHTHLLCQIGGDAHINNFGFFATPDDKVVFDVNDFDETIRGPWEWDVKRMAASVIVAAREDGGKDIDVREAVGVFLQEYCRWVRRFAKLPAIQVARHRVRRNMQNAVLQSALVHAERASPAATLQKICVRRGNNWIFRHITDALWDVKSKTSATVLKSLVMYRETLTPSHQNLFDKYKAVDVGFKLVGVGSVGTRDYVVLMFGADENDPLLLQVKEEPHSAYAPHLSRAGLCDTGPTHQGQRVVCGQHSLQVLSDLLLGWTTIDGRDYLVRQLNDHKSSVKFCALKKDHMTEYMRVTAEVLAKGHCRSGDPVAMAAYLGASEKAALNLSKFAFAYADQVEQDFNGFRKALRNGTLKQ